ncbi:MAG: matrix protein [Artemisia capillaris nucleorhabdovirus 1]|uniref:Matrix protein n=1 Tax=Artemisia capillaris nucleorhabdovirus 1 TaxID=2912606 RepID=A0AAX2ZNK1_9RHAB|nr:MAG: matrix protein [Artemisia capillaris nucleorhabdovirus 1]UKL15219.1 MAG: matrix protein [Artemisia capillaris nucleorhabdovirus 1]
MTSEQEITIIRPTSQKSNAGIENDGVVVDSQYHLPPIVNYSLSFMIEISFYDQESCKMFLDKKMKTVELFGALKENWINSTGAVKYHTPVEPTDEQAHLVIDICCLIAVLRELPFVEGIIQTHFHRNTTVLRMSFGNVLPQTVHTSIVPISSQLQLPLIFHGNLRYEFVEDTGKIHASVMMGIRATAFPKGNSPPVMDTVHLEHLLPHHGIREIQPQLPSSTSSNQAQDGDETGSTERRRKREGNDAGALVPSMKKAATSLANRLLRRT